MDTILFLKYFSFTGECKTMFLRETWVKLHQFDIVLIMIIKLQKTWKNFVWSQNTWQIFIFSTGALI